MGHLCIREERPFENKRRLPWLPLYASYGKRIDNRIKESKTAGTPRCQIWSERTTPCRKVLTAAHCTAHPQILVRARLSWSGSQSPSVFADFKLELLFCFKTIQSDKMRRFRTYKGIIENRWFYLLCEHEYNTKYPILHTSKSVRQQRLLSSKPTSSAKSPA